MGDVGGESFRVVEVEPGHGSVEAITVGLGSFAEGTEVADEFELINSHIFIYGIFITISL